MDFIKGNEQVKIDPDGINFVGNGNITIDSEKITGDISLNGKVSITNDFDITAKPISLVMSVSMAKPISLEMSVSMATPISQVMPVLTKMFLLVAVILISMTMMETLVLVFMALITQQPLHFHVQILLEAKVQAPVLVIFAQNFATVTLAHFGKLAMQKVVL